MWKDVLGHLRDNMMRLDWVSLRRIGYEKHFDEQWAAAGAEVPDDPPGGVSESEDESDGDFEHHIENGDFHDHSEGSSAFTDSDEERESDDEHGPAAHEINFPVLHPDTPSSIPWCNCDGRSYPDIADDLGDDGIFVSNLQRKMWE
ncbi:hypothetical protein LTR16_008475, partial [Cryomyces antarcticus]